MFEFRPTRASPQLRPLRQSSTQTSLTTTTTTTDTSTSSALPTLTDADIRIIDAIIKRAPASATSFPAVFKAYNEVLQEEGLDPLQDILYYRFLLKMTVIRGNWGERWEQTKKQQRLIDAGDGDTEIEANSDAETDVCPNQKPTTPKPVLGSLTFNRPRSRTEMPSTTPRHTPSAVTRPQPRTRPSSTSDEAGDSGPPSYRTYVTEKQQPAAKETKTPRPQPKSTTKLPPSSVTRPTPRSILKQTPKPTPASIPPPKQHTPATPVPPPRTLAAFAEAAARAGKLKLAGLNTDVGDGKTSAINAEETWKVLRMEREADDFRRDFLIRKCIEVWAEGVRWIAKTNSQVDDARKDILIRDVLSKWRSIVSHRLDLQRRADNVAAVLGIRAALKKWRHVLREKRQKAWREDMKRRLGEMRKKVDSRIVNEAFWAWGHRHDEIKAQYIHSRRLLLKAIEKWRAKYSHVEQLNIVADNVMDSRDRIQQETTLALWRRKSKLNALERVMVQKRDAGIMHRAILVWINNAHMNRLAMVHQRKYILRTMLQRWRNALAYVDRLDRRVTKYVLRQDAILVRAVLRVWVAKERGGLLERVRKTRLLRSTMAVWKDRLKHTRELEDRATAYIANTNLDLMGRAFAIMRHKTKMYQNAVIVADQQYHKPLMARFFVNWKVELAMNKRRERSAKVARRFFSVQSAWKQWRLALAIKKREKIEAEVQRRWLKRWFLTWRDQARKQKEWKWLVTAFKEKVDYRIMSESLNTWISRVVDIKSNELRVSDEYDTRLMKMAVTRWKQVRARHIEEMSLMQSYHDVKRDDLARRVFLKWLGTTRKSVHRRRKLEQKEEENKHLVLVNAWQKWREKYKERELSDLEQQLIMQRNMSILFRTFRIWESKCLSVPAVRFFSLNIKTKMWNRWREALPRAQRESEAKDIWKKKVMSQVFATWKKAYEAKTSLKSIARARNLRLPTAVNSRPSYQRPSTSPFARVANTGLISRLSATPPERPARFGSASPVRNGFAGDTDNRSRRARSRSPEPKAANISGPTTKTPARTSLLSKAYARPQADVAPIIVEIDMPSKSGPTPPKSHKAPSVAGGSRGIIEDDAPPPPKRTIDHLRGHSIGRRLGDAKTDGDAMSVVRGRSERDAETYTPAGGRPSGLTRTLSIGGDNAFGASERYKLRMELRQKGLLSGVKGIGGNAAGDQTR
ncbi:hypothetical protein FRC03_009479 [Tulasnella sp. 419]|nr:hypothetical protein FRC03_009479 [Tulasnella sp. 419]